MFTRTFYIRQGRGAYRAVNLTPDEFYYLEGSPGQGVRYHITRSLPKRFAKPKPLRQRSYRRQK
jgi:hypothetical protein